MRVNLDHCEQTHYNTMLKIYHDLPSVKTKYRESTKKEAFNLDLFLLILNVFFHFYYINPIQLSKPKNPKHWPLQHTLSCAYWMLGSRLSVEQLLEGIFSQLWIAVHLLSIIYFLVHILNCVIMSLYNFILCFLK